jgi:hypothetical protein
MQIRDTGLVVGTWRFQMRAGPFAGLSLFAALMLSSSAAFATVAFYDGVGVPIGIIPGGLYLSAENSFETLITAPGQPFSGIFKVANIVDQSTATQTYTYGQNGAYLTGFFDNFISDTVVPPTATTPGRITLFGGEIKYFVEGSNTFTDNAGQPADFANASSGKLWLYGLPATIDAAGHTLTITIPANNGLGVFSNASATTFIDAVGGDAMAAFNTNTFVNPFSHTGNNDILFQGTANSGSPNDFPISGVNALKANLLKVPEPLSIALFGAGLAGMAVIFRRKKKG